MTKLLTERVIDMKHSYNEENWTWYQLKEKDIADFKEIVGKKASFDKWSDALEENKTNSLVINTTESGEEHIFGSLIYQQDIDDRNDKKIFYFYLEEKKLATAGFEFESIESCLPDDVEKQMESVDNALEGFFIILGEILNAYLFQLDQYEEHLHDLIWRMKKKNDLEMLEKITDNRHELLIWKNLMIPLRELQIGAEEAYGDKITDKKEYIRVCKRLERSNLLISEYMSEIDTMIGLEEVVSTHRGNEIMKTLTVMTLVFTPVGAWGALWGMNFKVMPELDWPFGYVFAILTILISTAAIYAYLKMKGWTGDTLKTRKKDSFYE